MNEKQLSTYVKLFDDGECPICYSSPQVDKAIPPCGHVFCYQCLINWNNISRWRTTCPVCSTAFYEISHKNRKEQIRPIIIHDLAQVQHDFLQFIFYMEGTPHLLFIFTVTLVMALNLSTTGIFRILMIMFTFTSVFLLMSQRRSLTLSFQMSSEVSFKVHFLIFLKSA